MLKTLRKKKTAKKIWLAVIAATIVSFVFWGSGAMRSRKESAYAGKIFGKIVSYLDYKDALDAVRNQAIMQFGDNFSEIQKILNLESQAWERLILLEEAKRRKITVTDREVIELIESYPFFQRKGQFDNRIYAEMLQYVFHTQPRTFEEQTRQNLMLSKLYKQITKDISLNEGEIKDEYQKFNEEVSIYYIAGLYSDFLKEITPSEQEIKDYFANNALQFKQPLSFNLDYVALDSESKIKDLVKRLNKKGGFERIAKDSGLTVKETGLFTQTEPIPGIGWSAEILNLISKLKVGEFSSPIHSDKYYLLRLKERKEPYIPDFSGIKDKVREAFIKNKAQEIAKEKIGNCLKKLKEAYQTNPKSVNFTQTAKIYGLKSDSTSLFKYGSYVEGIGASDIFWTAAQRLKEGEFSEVISMPSGFYIIKVKERIPVDEKKFATEKQEFSEKILAQKKQEYFSKFLEELNKKTQ